jgi:hypothetical protein
MKKIMILVFAAILSMAMLGQGTPTSKTAGNQEKPKTGQYQVKHHHKAHKKNAEASKTETKKENTKVAASKSSTK